MKKHSHKTKKPAFSHDRFFKSFYSDRKFSKELLALIFSKKEAQAYNLNKLKVEKDTFGDKRADLVLSVPFKSSPKVRVRIFILLEHKSSYDKNYYDQLLDYQFLLRKLIIQQTGYAQPIMTVLFYHGREPLKWKKSLQEEDFKSFFSKIPMESRKSMLNYEPKIINTQDPKIQKAYKGKRLKGHGIIKLLSEIWGLKKKITPSKVIDAYTGFEEVLKGLKGQERKITELRILGYLNDNTDLSLKVWKKAEKLLIEKGILKQGGLMQDVIETIEEKGRWKGRQEGRKEGRQEGRQEVILNMLKKRLDISLISEVTGLPAKEIKKLKNGA